METKNTNFEGCWEDECSYCGKPQKEHQKNIGDHEGITYLHRQPCSEEQKVTTRKAQKTADVQKAHSAALNVSSKERRNEKFNYCFISHHLI